MEVHGVDGLVDGDVGKPAIQATTLLVVNEGALASLEELPVVHLIQLALLEVGEVAGELLTLPLVGHQLAIQMSEFLLPLLELLVFNQSLLKRT
jgi:hypothetical protein